MLVEQPDNVARAVKKGWGVGIAVHPVSKLAQSLQEALTTVLQVPSFAEQAGRVSQLMRAHRWTPAEVAASKSPADHPAGLLDGLQNDHHGDLRDDLHADLVSFCYASRGNAECFCAQISTSACLTHTVAPQPRQPFGGGGGGGGRGAGGGGGGGGGAGGGGGGYWGHWVGMEGEIVER